MRTTQQFSITLPNEMADAVKSKVAAGEYRFIRLRYSLYLVVGWLAARFGVSAAMFL